MTPTIVAVEVDRPADEVFAYAIDPTHFHEWQNGVVTGRMDRPGMPQVGDHCVTRRRIGGASGVLRRPRWCASIHPTPGVSAGSTARSG